MAYLIHANHWPLKRAYAFVLERRKGISPNIGFVSELMTFEEQELGGKSGGVAGGNALANGGDDDDEGNNKGGNYTHAVSSRRPGHMRESLPPIYTSTQSTSEILLPGQFSAGGHSAMVVGDSGQETEIRDGSGRYRHLRRAPVDETTLQPARRVSKAGLESSLWNEGGQATAHSPLP